MTPSFLELPGGKRLAYHLSEGKLPGIVFLGGFNSDMTGTKATSLEAYCQKIGQRFVRFDYSGHGQSSGAFTEGTIGGWAQDALAILDSVAPGRNVLVGSSMGGWIMLLAALDRREQVTGLVGIASAPDFTERLIWDLFTEGQKTQIRQDTVINIPSCYDGGEPYPIAYNLITEGCNQLLLDAPIALSIPVRLLHGTKDEDVPWQVSMQLMEALVSSDVQLTLVKGAGHRMSEPEQLALLHQKVAEVLLLAV